MSGKGTPFSRESSNKCQPSTLFTGFFVRYAVWPRLLPPITQICPVATWEYMYEEYMYAYQTCQITVIFALLSGGLRISADNQHLNCHTCASRRGVRPGMRALR